MHVWFDNIVLLLTKFVLENFDSSFQIIIDRKILYFLYNLSCVTCNYDWLLMIASNFMLIFLSHFVPFLVMEAIVWMGKNVPKIVQFIFF